MFLKNSTLFILSFGFGFLVLHPKTLISGSIRRFKTLNFIKSNVVTTMVNKFESVTEVSGKTTDSYTCKC